LRNVVRLLLQRQHFLNFWGIGLVSEVSNNIDAEEKAKLGKIGYYLSTIRTVKNAETFPVFL
ncbi:hypothetical protein ACT4UT_09705, partial [Bacillus sp. B-TM1]